MKLNKTILTLSMLSVLCFGILADDAIITIQPECRTFYADRAQTFTIFTKNVVGERLSWNLRYAGRTLASGEQKVPQNGIIKIEIKFPKLNQGVIAATEFSAWVGKRGRGNRLSVIGGRLGKEKNEKKGMGNKALGNRGQALEGKGEKKALGKDGGEGNTEEERKGHRAKGTEGNEGRKGHRVKGTEGNTEIRRSLYFFYPNPFEGEKKALEARQIGVWEVTEGGNFSKLLKSFDVPFAEVVDPEQFNGRVLFVIGVDFDSSPGVLDALLKLAEKGKKVIVLPPIAGKIALPINQLNRFILGGNEYIGIRSQAIGNRKKGKESIMEKFDTESWNGKAVAQSSFNLIPSGEIIEIELNDNSKGFTYCELRVKKVLGKDKNAIQSNGKVIIITWSIVKGAKASPTPVYLLRDMMFEEGNRH